MGIHVIRVPDIGEGIAEVELVAWHVKPGDAVVEDQLLADVMTDKATVEVPSPAHGTVLALGGAVGQVVAVGAELLRLEVQGAGNLRESAHGHAPAAAAQLATPPMPAQEPPAVHAEHAIPVIGLRRRIAQKMQESTRRIPHFSYVEEVDVTELETLRAQLNRRHGATRGKLTVLPLLVRALALAVRDFPQVNARYDDEADVVTRFEALHLGVATQTAAGLMVPVLRHAEALDLWACAAGIARVAEGARSGKTPREELAGSTLTVTSLGALGGIASTPIINHPEVAIVGVNRIVERPMLRGGQVTARQLMNLSSSFDHRVVDGMDAAQFIQAVRALLETPALLFVE